MSDSWNPEGDGWPHPNAWISALVASLRVKAGQYELLKAALSAPENSLGRQELLDHQIGTAELRDIQQRLILDCLTTLTSSLMQLPAISDERLIMPLHDLVQEIGNLRLGHSARLLESSINAAPGQDTLNKVMVKIWAVACLRMLVLLPTWRTKGGAKAARELIAKTFEKKHPWVKERNLGNWNKSGGSIERMGAPILKAACERFSTSPDWPFPPERAADEVDRIAKSDALAEYQAKAGSN